MFLPRLVFYVVANDKRRYKQNGFSKILFYSNKKIANEYNNLISKKENSQGFINFENKKSESENYLPYFADIKEVRNIINKNNVDEAIIALDINEYDMFNFVVNKLVNVDVEIKSIPSIYDILTGRIRMNSILGIPLISVSDKPMPLWQQKIKKYMDIFIAAFALAISSPLILLLAIGVKITSKGPVFYSHERIGIYGRPFKIYKFRSMYVDAEKDGPELSSKTDPRITPFGKFMRRTRMDEIPNFINVLKGEMSIVGPRPERRFYIDQIVQKAPHYLHLLKIKPGITSLGQIKFGYAENVEQMIQRLRFDLKYLSNMSILVDMKIMASTVFTIIKRKGI